MFIAKDKNGEFNAFIVKPIRVCNCVFDNKPTLWSTRPFPPVWRDIPDSFIQSLGIGMLSEMTWESDPVEVDLKVVPSRNVKMMAEDGIIFLR